MPSYVVISPVKDEQQYIQTTLQSMVAQTLRPVRWIIVDDGSSDHTAALVEAYARKHSWISLVKCPNHTARAPGSAVVRAFNTGFKMTHGESFDFVVKLDCDLRIPPTHFEQLLQRFERDPSLGIASGVYVERQNGMTSAVPMPDYHAAGAAKVVRARCFDEIGGFVASRGWDTVDEIRAQTLGWRTCHFTDLQFDHLRPEGSSRGPLYTSLLHGEVYYLTDGPCLFFLLKVAYRMVWGKPPVLAGAMLLAGFLRPWLLRRPRLINRAESRWYRNALQQRVRNGLAQATAQAGLNLSRGSKF